MPSLVTKLVMFARSPQGRRTIEQAKRMAQDPKNQERLRQLRGRMQQRRPR